MIHLNIILETRNEADVPTVKELLTEQARLCREEPGCHRYEVYHSQNDSKLFLIHEWWENQDALDVHRTAPGYVQIYKPQVLPLVERIPHPSDLLE